MRAEKEAGIGRFWEKKVREGGGRGEKGGGGEEGKIKKKRPNGKMEKRGEKMCFIPHSP